MPRPRTVPNAPETRTKKRAFYCARAEKARRREIRVSRRRLMVLYDNSDYFHDIYKLTFSSGIQRRRIDADVAVYDKYVPIL